MNPDDEKKDVRAKKPKILIPEDYGDKIVKMTVNVKS
jgi:hypothetical protein